MWPERKTAAVVCVVTLLAALHPSTARPAGYENTLTYGYNPSRNGWFAAAGPYSIGGKYLSVKLGAAVRGAPLFVKNWRFDSGPRAGQSRDVVFVTTSDNQLYAFAEEELLKGESAPIWSQNLGHPSMNGCTNLPPPPIGISSTPVIDLPSRRMFVLALVDDGSESRRCVDILRGTGAHTYGNVTYYIDAIALDTGRILASVPLRDRGGEGRPTFDANLEDQRGGLNLVNGRIYAVFGGLYYHDLCAYHGWVTSIDAHNLNDQFYFPLTKKLLGAGAWGPGGAAAANDATLYVATGNAPDSAPRAFAADVVPCAPPPPAGSYAGDTSYWAHLPAGVHPGDSGEYFLAVVRLGLQRTSGPLRMKVEDWFQPIDARSLNDEDLEMGSSSPLLLPAIDGRQMLLVGCKDGSIFLLDRMRLGHWSRGVQRLKVFSGGAKGAAAYIHIHDEDLVFVSGSGMPGLVCYKVVVGGKAPHLVELWRANIAFGKYPGSPMLVAAPDGSATVWIVDASGDASASGVLRVFNAIDGTEIYDSSKSASDDLGPVPRFPNMAFGSRTAFVGTLSGFACYRLITRSKPAVTH